MTYGLSTVGKLVKVADSKISSHAYIGDGVRLGAGVSVGPGAVLLGPAIIGDGAWIGSGVSIGAPPEISSLEQNTAWTGELEHAGVEIGDGAVIREHVVIHQGSHRPTRVGAGSWILNSAYLAHDVQIGNGATVSAGVSVGGHAIIGEHSNIGMNAVIHQGRIIGPGSMVGMGTPVSRDIPPFGKVFGTPPRLNGINVIGMQRSGIGDKTIAALVRIFESGDLLLESDDARQSLGAIDAAVAWWTAKSDRLPVRLGKGFGK